VQVGPFSIVDKRVRFPDLVQHFYRESQRILNPPR
jgi:hypothetical protein